MTNTDRAIDIGANVEKFVRETVVPYERDPRRDHHGAPLDDMVMEMRDKARVAGVLTPHILSDGTHLTQLETAYVLQKSGISPLGPDLPPSEWPNFYFRNGHEGGLKWQGSTSRKTSSASCVKRRSC